MSQLCFVAGLVCSIFCCCPPYRRWFPDLCQWCACAGTEALGNTVVYTNPLSLGHIMDVNDVVE